MFQHFLLLLSLFISVAVQAEDQQIADLLERNHMQGSMVIVALKTGQSFVHDDARARQRFIVASTFKILNTLIAQQEGVVGGKNSLFKWDGQVRSIAAWNRDQTLESAFKLSCVWCYQQLAREIGAAKYRGYLHSIGYGQLREPFKVDRFWLDGSLKVSATDQVGFLKQVYQRSLPFSPAAYDTLQAIMLSEQTPTFALYAKTGLAGDTTPKIGWYVGYVVTADDVWFFATNLDISDDEQLPLRQSLTRQALQVKGILQ